MNTFAFLGEIGGGELLVVFVAILLLFGSNRLPEIARSIGRALEELRHASQNFRDQIMDADRPEPKPPRPPAFLPKAALEKKDLLSEAQDGEGDQPPAEWPLTPGDRPAEPGTEPTAQPAKEDRPDDLGG
jgi:sec-independent protein translocase protein TatA